MKIGIIELYGHNEVLYNFYRLLKNNFEVSVFTTANIHDDAKNYFQDDLKTWIVQPPTISKEQFIKKNLHLFNAQDQLLFTTIISSFSFFAEQNFKPTTILIIHNIHTMFCHDKYLWFDNRSVLNWGLDRLRFFRSRLRRDDFYKKKLLQNMDFISFPSDNLTQYAKTITSQYNHKTLSPMTFSFFEGIVPKENDEMITISISGSVIFEARDYEIVYEAFQKVIPLIKRKVRLQLLGSAQNEFGQTIIQKFAVLENEKFQFISFTEPLSQGLFDQHLRETDFMILPIKQNRKFGICKEEYGTSNISGGLNDILRFGLPSLLADFYQPEIPQNHLISFFSNQKELEEKLIDWINNLSFVKKQKQAIPFLEVCDEVNMINYVSKIIDEVGK